MAVNELQLGLIGAGVAVVGAVWIYNLWQERQHRKLAEKIFKGGQPDVLLQGQGGEERTEPSAAPSQESPERIEPAIEPTIPPAAPEPTEPAPVPPVELADEIADCMVSVAFPEPVSAPALWSVQAAWAEGLGKPLAWLGYDAAGRAWKRLNAHDAGRYGKVVAALQLADRQGAASDDDVEAFLDGVQRLASQFGGDAALPVADGVLEHARSLDGFCAGVDVQLAVNVVETAGGSFMGTKLRGLAEAAGMALDEDGRFHARDEEGRELFSLSNLGPELFAADSLKNLATVGISFVLDVPRVADGPAAFDRMVAAARVMSHALGGAVVDAQRHALTDAMVIGIRSKVAEIQRQMAVNQIPPGGARALRLFS
ncbi:MAG TPA: cell division protein ZipA C-terminal FtsZ-binding domain-containing protein [Rhodocyclaceae bacterium]